VRGNLYNTHEKYCSTQFSEDDVSPIDIDGWDEEEM
jgi:hypothetical protein